MNTPKYIIIHCAATKVTSNVTVEQIISMHKQRGFSTIGYHYYITKDGIIHKGRQENQVGAHCLGYNAKSIGICYEGGLDAASFPADTRTLEQKASLLALLRELKRIFPRALIVGHHDLNPTKACPCFDAEREYRGL